MRLVLLFLLGSALAAQPADLVEKARLARDLVVAGKSGQAIPIYEELVRAFPNDAGIIMNLAIADFKTKRYRDTIQQAERALQLQPELASAHLFLGASWIELKEPARAVSPLEKVIAAQPNDRNARLMLADALFDLGKYEDSTRHFQKVSEQAPDSSRAWYGLARSYDALGSRARQQLENGASAYALALSAEDYRKQRRYGSAHTNYRQALAKQPVLPGLHAGLAAVYRSLGHPDWAAKEEQQEPKIPPCPDGSLACDFIAGRYAEIIEAARAGNTPEALYWLVKSYEELARQAYDRLSRLPPSLERHLHAARSYDTGGQPLEAAKEWREALKLSPENREIQTALVWSMFKGGDYENLLPIAVQLLNQQPDSRDLNFLIGASLLTVGRPEKAIGHLENAIRQDSQFLPAHAALGRALLRAGKATEAIPHLRAALTIDEDGSGHFQLLRAYQITGQTDLARHALAEYQAFQKFVEGKEKFEDGTTITR
jgi:tetratricopeptide (TPR) repeat protein